MNSQASAFVQVLKLYGDAAKPVQIFRYTSQNWQTQRNLRTQSFRLYPSTCHSWKGGWVAFGEHLLPSSTSLCVVNQLDDFQRDGDFQRNVNFPSLACRKSRARCRYQIRKPEPLHPGSYLFFIFIGGQQTSSTLFFLHLKGNMEFIIGAVAALLGICAFAVDGTKISEQTYQLPKCVTPVASFANVAVD